MEAVSQTGRVATWLELAVAPEWRRQNCSVRLHAIGGKSGGCYALSMDGRWLCSSDGRLTVFKGLDSALRFLSIVRVEDFEPGEPTSIAVHCNGQHHCLCVGRDDCLVQCQTGGHRARLNS
jgi:hypothetical protein